MRRKILTAACAVALFSASAPCRADVDTEVPVPAKIQGSLGEGETEVARFFAPAGSLLQVKLSTKKTGGLDPALRVLDPDGAELPIPAGNLQDKGSKIKVKKLPLERSGVWAVEVSGAGSGDYKLVLKTKVPTKLVEDVQVGGENPEIVVPAAFGSTIKVTAKSSKGSPATPVLQSLDGEDLTGEGKRSDSSHKVSMGAGASGDLVLVVGGEGAAGGVRVTIAIQPPKTKTAKVDVRGVTLGRPTGGETAVGKVIVPAEGGDVAAGPESDLFGASVQVPAGALSEPTLISIRSSAPELLVDPGDASAGPTVEFGPSGLAFSQPVTVTVPIDVRQMPVQTTAEDIRVLIVEDDGTVREVVPISVDLDAGFCTLPASGFSRFTAIAPAGSPQLAGRGYWGFLFDANLEDDFTQRDESGVRRIAMGDALIDFDPDGESWSAHIDEREVFFGLDRDAQDDQLVPVFDVAEVVAQDTGTWGYGSGGRRIRLFFDGEEGEDRMFVSRDGSVLLNTTDEPEEGVPNDALLDLFVERPAADDPTSLLLGKYHFGELNLSVGPREDGALIEVELLSTWGTVTFKENGKLAIDVVHKEAFGVVESEPPAYEIGEFRDRLSVDWEVETTGPFAGAVLVDDGEDSTFRVFPHRDGRMFVMTNQSGDGEFGLLVGVRVSSGRDVSEIEGNHAVGTVFLEPNEYQIENGFPGSGDVRFVPDFAIASESSRLLFDGTDALTISRRGSLYQQRDPAERGGVLRERELGPDDTIGVSLANDGRLTFETGGDELRGGLAGDGSFGFVVQDPDNPNFGIVLFVNRPPQQPEVPQKR
jgi:hypothetical protein